MHEKKHAIFSADAFDMKYFICPLRRAKRGEKILVFSL